MHVVGSRCAKFETGQTFSYVQRDPTTPNIVGNVGSCWVPLHVAKDSLVAVFSRHATLLPPLRDKTKTAARETGKGEKGEKWRMQLKGAAAWAGLFEAGLVRNLNSNMRA